jgi:hypothetical protein
MRAVAATIGIAAAFLAFDSGLDVSPTLWRTPDIEEQANAAVRWDNAEELLISQPARIEALVSRITPAAGTSQAVSNAKASRPPIHRHSSEPPWTGNWRRSNRKISDGRNLD